MYKLQLLSSSFVWLFMTARLKAFLQWNASFWSQGQLHLYKRFSRNSSLNRRGQTEYWNAIVKVFWLNGNKRGLWKHTPCESDPPGIPSGLPVPAGHHQQTAGNGEGDDTQDDEEECGDPLWGQLWGDADPEPAVDGLALLNQTHSQRTWVKTERDILISKTTTRSWKIINKWINPMVNENELNNFQSCLSPPNRLDDKRVHSVHQSQHLGAFVP